MSDKERPRLTMDALNERMAPRNNCRVAAFRELLDDDDSREVFDAALDQLSGPGVRAFLLDAGFDPTDVPSETALRNHRFRREGCKCPR